MREEYFARMKHIAFRGGKIAIQLLSSGDFFFKPDKSKIPVALTTPINKTLQIIEPSLYSLDSKHSYNQ